MFFHSPKLNVTSVMCLYSGNFTLLLKMRLHFPHGASSAAADMHDCWSLNLPPVVFSDKRLKEAFWKCSAQTWSVTVVNHEIITLCYWTFNHTSQLNIIHAFCFSFFCVKLYDFPFSLICIYIFLHLCSFSSVGVKLISSAFSLIIHVWLLRRQRCNMLYFCMNWPQPLTSFMPQGSYFLVTYFIVFFFFLLLNLCFELLYLNLLF